MKPLKFRFISTFDYYDREKTGVKPYTIRRRSSLKLKQVEDLVQSFVDNRTIEVTIQRGYTSECFTRKISDTTVFDNSVIFAWVESPQKKQFREEHRFQRKTIKFVRHIEEHLVQMKLKGKVSCRICNKDIDEIYDRKVH